MSDTTLNVSDNTAYVGIDNGEVLGRPWWREPTDDGEHGDDHESGGAPGEEPGDAPGEGEHHDPLDPPGDGGSGGGQDEVGGPFGTLEIVSVSDGNVQVQSNVSGTGLQITVMQGDTVVGSFDDPAFNLVHDAAYTVSVSGVTPVDETPFTVTASTNPNEPDAVDLYSKLNIIAFSATDFPEPVVPATNK